MDTLTDSLAMVRRIQAFKKDHPVRAEVTGTRSLDMSQYIRQHCRPSKTGCGYKGVELGGFVPIDLDWIVHDYHHKLLQLIEVKTNGGKVGFSQRQTLELLDYFIRLGIVATAGTKDGYTYLGLHTLILQNTTPIKSTWREWDGERISAEECWRRINMFDAVESKLARQHETKEGLEREPVEVRAAEPPTTGGESASAKQAAEPFVDSQVQEQDKQPF